MKTITIKQRVKKKVDGKTVKEMVDVTYFIRDIEWEDLPNLNLYGLMRMFTDQNKIREPYIKAKLKELNLHEPISPSDDKMVMELIELSEDDEERMKEITFRNIGLFNPFLKAMIVKPSIQHIPISVGMQLIKNEVVLEVIHETVEDLISMNQVGDKNPEKKL